MNRIKTVQCFHALVKELQQMPGSVKRNISSLDFEAFSPKKSIDHEYEYSTQSIVSQAVADDMLVSCIEFKKPLEFDAPLKLTAREMASTSLFPATSYYQTERQLASCLVLRPDEDFQTLFPSIVTNLSKALAFLKSKGLGYGLLECTAYRDKNSAWRTALSLRIGELIPGFNKEIHGFILIDTPCF